LLALFRGLAAGPGESSDGDKRDTTHGEQGIKRQGIHGAV
jgi:hypothetical protein